MIRLSRAKLFLENFFAYGFINVLNKIIPFLLLPVITRMLSGPSDYGVYDMYTTIVGFGSPLAMLGMYDAMFREYFEKEDQQYKFNVTSTANRIVMSSSLIIGLVLVVFNKLFSELLYGTNIYGIIVVFAAVETIISTNKTIISAPTRIQNHRKVYISSGLFSSISYYILAILLIYLGYSYFGMIYANIISSVLLLIFFWMLNRSFFTKGKFDKNIAKELFKIGLPLLPTFLIYWIYQSMDKIMIANMLGTSELGIYSIGAKVASISSLIYAAFSGGWQHFAFSTMKDKDYKYMMGKVWEYMFVISSCFTIVAFMFKDIIFNVLFEGSYNRGVEVFPYLLLSPFLQMLFQILGTQFQIIKKTYFTTTLQSIGAIINIVLNAYLIPIMGIKGAAIATVTGFAATTILYILLVVVYKKLVYFNIKIFIIVGIFMGIFIIINYLNINLYSMFICLSYLILCVVLYYRDVLNFIAKGKN